MKKKEKTELHAMKPSELMHEAGSLEQKIQHLRIDRFAKPMKNTREIRSLKRRLAVVKTVLQEKENTHEA